MKKTLLVSNIAIYTLMYHIALIYAAFDLGSFYRFDRLLRDGALPIHEYPWSDFYVPVLLLALLFVQFIFLRERDNLSAKAIAIFGVVTWIPFLWWFVIAYKYTDVKSGMTYGDWCSLGMLILASVIFVFDIICAIITYREDRRLKKKFDTAP